MFHLFSFKKEKKVKRPERVPVVLHTLASRFKDRRNHRTIGDAIDAAALEQMLSMTEIAGDVPPQIRVKSGQNSDTWRAN
jgi:hypothetical protein